MSLATCNPTADCEDLANLHYRLEAEAMLGPDGKRCRKCHPVVVELVDGEEFGADGVMWREVAGRTAQKC